MHILITGGCGFIGTNLCIHLKKRYSKYHVIAFDNFIRKGSSSNIPRLKKAGVEIIRGDIRDKHALDNISPCHVIIDAAADPSVLAGLDDNPSDVIHTNLMGTIHSLEWARKHKSLFIFLSTSRIYPFDKLNAIPYLEENSRFVINQEALKFQSYALKGIPEFFEKEGPKSFYGATKYTSEQFIQEYNTFYQVPTIINRCGLVAGPFQMGKIDQGVVVLWAAAHYWKQSLRYIGFGGNGKQVRDILHVLDLCELIDFQIHDHTAYTGNIYNVGGGLMSTTSLLELTHYCEEKTGNAILITPEKATRPADVRIYYTDHSKLTKQSGWAPTRSLSQCLDDIFQWFEEEREVLINVLT